MENSKRVRPDETSEQREIRRKRVVEEWAKVGLTLNDVYGSTGGKLGNSFDAQRLIFIARSQGKEDACIEAIYKANHEEGKCLSDLETLLAAAASAGLVGAREALASGEGINEVAEKIASYHKMGLNSVPVVIINEMYVLQGYPQPELLEVAFAQLIEQGTLG